ncbi:MAG TPA: thioredoxin family protein [Polyangiaceae bacterium]
MIQVKDDTFGREVLEAKGTVLVDFGATWCPPCKVLKPIVESIAREHASSLKVVYVDMDEAPKTVQQCGIRAAPTLVVYRDGEKRAVHVGAVPKEKILALLER